VTEAATRETTVPKPHRPRDRGTDELNLAEFPLAAVTHRPAPHQKTLEFGDHIFDEGAKQNIHRRVIISGSDRYGLPTPLDTDVLLVLIHHTGSQNGFTGRTVKFSRYELVRSLGWDTGGKSYRRLDDSLYKWAGTTLYYHGAWWDKSVRTWRSRTFHVIESLDLKGRGSGVSTDDLQSSFTWNETLFDSFRANNLKSLNLDVYFGLKSGTARQAYRFLDKRFYRAKRLEFDLRVFACEHVGLSRNYDSAQLKRRLEPALRELEGIGFLERLSADRRYRKDAEGTWKVVLVRRNERHVPQQTETASNLAQELIARGVFAAEARKLAERHSEALIREKIGLHDWLLHATGRTRLMNPAGFLAKAVACDLPLPDDYKKHMRCERQRKDGRKRAAASEMGLARTPDENQTAEEISRCQNVLSSLGADEQVRLEAAAVDAASPFHKATYRRLQPMGGDLFKAFRDRLLVSHLQTHGDSQVPTVPNDERD
jgi:hypothetical protein